MARLFSRAFLSRVIFIETIQIVIDKEVLAAYDEHYFSIHKKARKRPIPHPYHESINQWMILRRPEMNALKQRWKDFIVWLVDRNGYANLDIDSCKMEYTVFYPTRARHDVDNIVPKFIQDGLVESGMIVDDDSTHITSLLLQCGYDKTNPRTEILIILNGKGDEI